MMDNSLRKTIVGLVILSVILFVAGFILFRTMFPDYYFRFFPVLIIIFFLINSGFFIFFHRSLKKSPNQFVRSFMASTGIKLVIFFVLILSYMLASPRTAMPFAITLSVFYVAYTAYDLVIMLSLLKRRKEFNNLPDHLSN